VTINYCFCSIILRTVIRTGFVVRHTQCAPSPMHLIMLRLYRAEALNDVLSDVWCLTSGWRLSVAYIGRNSRIERPKKRHRGSPCHTWLGYHFVADVLNSQHAGTGATWRINTKVSSTCRGRRHIVAAARLPLVASACRSVWQQSVVVFNEFRKQKLISNFNYCLQ